MLDLHKLACRIIGPTPGPHSTSSRPCSSVPIKPEVKQTAPNTALAIPEIVELILLCLDIRTILTGVKRTCRLWNHIIQKSPSVQKHLFFTPEESHAEKILNPLLAEVFPSFFPHNGQISSEEALGDILKGFSAESLDLFRNPHKANAYIREDASWRRMLVQQPPANGLSFFEQGLFELMPAPDLGEYEIRTNTDERYPGINNRKNDLRMETLFELIMLDERIRFSKRLPVIVNIHWGRQAVANTSNPHFITDSGMAMHPFNHMVMDNDVVVTVDALDDVDVYWGTRPRRATEDQTHQNLVYSYYRRFNGRMKPRATNPIAHVKIVRYLGPYTDESDL